MGWMGPLTVVVLAAGCGQSGGSGGSDADADGECEECATGDLDCILVLSDGQSMGNCPAFEGRAWGVDDAGEGRGYFPPGGASSRRIADEGWRSWTLTKSFGN